MERVHAEFHRSSLPLDDNVPLVISLLLNLFKASVDESSSRSEALVRLVLAARRDSEV
jgi:hypothetical protein